MNPCCETPAFEPPKGAHPVGSLKTVALIGPPNSGKSTLFNRLTGLRQKVANYPGVTVEQRMGLMAGVGRHDLTLIDLPGIYSLTPYSEDARVAVDVLQGNMPGTPKPDAVLLVLDSLHLTRQLMLAGPVLSVGLPTLVLLNMTDLMESRGGQVDPLKLAREIGAPGRPDQCRPRHRDRRRSALPQPADRARPSSGRPRSSPAISLTRFRQRRQRSHVGRAGQPPHRLPSPSLGRRHTQDRQHPPPSHLGTASLSSGRCRRLRSRLLHRPTTLRRLRRPARLHGRTLSAPFFPPAGFSPWSSTAHGRASPRSWSSSPRFCCSSSSSESLKTPATWPAPPSSPTASCAPSASTAKPSSRCSPPTPAPSLPSWPRAPLRTSATASPPSSSRPS